MGLTKIEQINRSRALDVSRQLSQALGGALGHDVAADIQVALKGGALVRDERQLKVTLSLDDAQKIVALLTPAQPATPPALTKWVVLYTRIPTNYNPQCKLVIEAASAADARDIARDHLGDRGKAFATYAIEDTKPFEPLAVPGRVVGGAQ